MQITNPELRELDKKVAEFYKLNRLYINNLTNLHGKEIHKTKYYQILKQSEKTNLDSEFDKIIFKNIISNLTINQLVLDYITDPNFKLSIEEFIDQIAGKGSFEYLEKKVRSPNWELRWNSCESSMKRNSYRISIFTMEAQELAQIELPKIKENILEYGKSKSLLPSDFDMTLFLLPPKEGEEYSSWDPHLKLFNLASETFEFYLKDNKISINPAFVYKTAFHEILGHAVHQIYSQNLPLSIKFTNEVGSITPTKSITEGFAKNKEVLCFEFLRDRLNEFKLTDENLEVLGLSHELGHQTNCEELYFSLIKDKERKSKNFDSYRHILELTNNHLIAKNIKNSNLEFKNAWYNLGHTFGPIHYKRMEDIVKQRFGEEYIQKNKKEFNIATARWVWSWEVYPNAVCYFLKNP